MILNYTVKDFMATKLITFLPKTPIEVAVSTFLKNKISGAPVINEKYELIGVISENDYMRTLMEYSYHNDLGDWWRIICRKKYKKLIYTIPYLRLLISSFNQDAEDFQ